MMTQRTPDKRHAELCVKYVAKLLPALRERARELGYALGKHGSLGFDIDIIAVPWTAEAVEAGVLAEGLRLIAEQQIGYAFISPREDDPYHRAGMRGEKPHGRRSWQYHLGGGPYIDLAVMPREADTPTCAALIVALRDLLYVPERERNKARAQAEAVLTPYEVKAP